MSAASPSPPPTDDADVNALLDAARVPLSVSGAAAALAAGGLVVGLLGAQNLTIVTWVGAYALVPWALLAVGAAAVFVAAKLMHARRWTLVPALALSILLALGAIGFFVLSSAAGVFTPLSLLGIAGGVCAIVFSAIAIGPFRRIAATRRRLRDAGFDLDL
ncbi:MAG TPA: hypothetical protein VGL86_00475 [Polyangia bacterium]|jgi:hypothetical protein